MPVEVVYDPNRRMMRVVNRGQLNMLLWGMQFGTDPKAIEIEPRYIAPEGFYELSGEAIEMQLLGKTGIFGKTMIPMLLYFTNDEGVKYVVKVLVYGQTENLKVTIRTQTTAITRILW